MYRLLSKIKSKQVDPKFYSIVLRTSQPNNFQEYLWTGVAYMLEEALEKAKAEMARQGLMANSYFLSMYQEHPARRIVEAMSTLEIQVEKMNEEKNKLMQKIINSPNGKELLEENKHKFRVEEMSFLKSKLKI